MIVKAGEVHRFYVVASDTPTIRVLRESEELVAAEMQQQATGLFYYDMTLEAGLYVVVVELGDRVMDAKYVKAAPTTTDESIDLVRKILTNTKKVVGTNLVIYDDDGATPLISWSLLDESGDPIDRNPMQAIRQ